jgi:hypothetical protein
VAWTTDDLLSAVRRSGFLPDAHDLSSSDLLAFADEEAATLLADLWKTSREEHRVSVEDIPLVVGTTRYRIPRRALSRGVRGITYLDTNGDESPAQELSPLEAWRYQTSSGLTASVFYYFEDDEIVLPTAPTSSGTKLRVRYYKRPPRMVAVSSGAAIYQAASATTLYFSAAPPSAVRSIGAYVDIVRGDSPFPAIYEDLIVDNYLGGVTFDVVFTTSSIDTDDISTSGTDGARVDYLVPRDCTVYPPLPQELHPVLVSAVVRRAMGALRDRDGAELAEADLRARREAAINVLEPRNADRKPRIISRSGALRGRGGQRGWWGR